MVELNLKALLCLLKPIVIEQLVYFGSLEGIFLENSFEEILAVHREMSQVFIVVVDLLLDGVFDDQFGLGGAEWEGHGEAEKEDHSDGEDVRGVVVGSSQVDLRGYEVGSSTSGVLVINELLELSESKVDDFDIFDGLSVMDDH